MLLELVLSFVQRNVDDLALLALNVDLCVELLQYFQEGLAWWAPRCAEEYSDILVRVLELIDGALLDDIECLAVPVTQTDFLPEQAGAQDGLDGARRHKQQLRVVIWLLSYHFMNYIVYYLIYIS